MIRAKAFHNIVTSTNRITSTLNRLHLIPQRSLLHVGSDQVFGSYTYQIDKPKYIYPCNYEGRRYISKRRSVRIPPTKPVTFPDSGEVDSSLEYLNPDTPRPGFNIPELKSSNDMVKKLFSIGFADGRVVKEQRLENLLKQVKEHPADISSLEVKIAKMTVEIRTQMKHVQTIRKDKWAKRMLFERIQKRRSWIHELRKRDIERFDWLLKELKIKYIPYKEFNFKLGKRALAKKAARDRFLAIKRQKIDEFREKLESEREAFDKEKEHELQAIEEELKSLRIGEFKSIEDTLDALKHGKSFGPRVKKKLRNRELALANKFELYKHRREESLNK